MQGLASLAAALLICMGLPAVGHGYEPRVNYQLQCMGCHRADGTGESGRVPSVRGTLVRFSMIPAGREFVLRVPGVAQSPLTDADMAAVLNWMARNLSDGPLPAGFRDYDAGEVRAVRGRPLAQVSDAREKLLEQVDTPHANDRTPTLESSSRQRVTGTGILDQ